ncbi:hypothetical protein AAMO2058_000700100 [Amorphochlora amoebiformis]
MNGRNSKGKIYTTLIANITKKKKGNGIVRPPVSVRIRDVVVSFLLIPFVDCTLVPFIHLGPVDAKGFVEKPFWVRLVIRPFRLPFHEIRIVCDRGHLIREGKSVCSDIRKIRSKPRLTVTHLSNGTGSGPPS